MTSRLNVYEFLRFLSASDKEALEVYRPLAHKHIVVTGKLDEGVLRETLVDALAKWGAVIEMHVTPSTDVLLAVDPDRMTAKRKDAARYGVSVLNEYAFTAWLNDARERAIEEAARLRTYTAPPPPPEWFAGDTPEPEEFVDGIVPLPNIAP